MLTNRLRVQEQRTASALMRRVASAAEQLYRHASCDVTVRHVGQDVELHPSRSDLLSEPRFLCIQSEIRENKIVFFMFLSVAIHLIHLHHKRLQPRSSFSSLSLRLVLLLPVHLRHQSLLYSAGTVLHVHYVPGLMSVPPGVTTLNGQGRGAVILRAVRWTRGVFPP